MLLTKAHFQEQKEALDRLQVLGEAMIQPEHQAMQKLADIQIQYLTRYVTNPASLGLE